MAEILLADRPRVIRPPVRLRPRLEGIPASLRAIPQWVCWRYSPKPDGTWPKVPKSANLLGLEAKTNDPRTWAPFEQAWERYSLCLDGATRAGLTPEYDGIGFIFPLEPGNLVGVDLDKCVDPETRFVEPACSEIVEELRGFAEYSPSGRGIHVFVEGKLPIGHYTSNKAKVEIYSRRRFFTVTGHPVEGFPDEIPARPDEIIAIYEQTFADKIAVRRESDRVMAERRAELERRAQERAARGITFVPTGNELWPTGYSDAAYRRHIESFLSAIPGDPNEGRHARLRRAAYAIGGYLAGEAPGALEALGELERHALAAMPGRAEEVKRTVASSARAGMTRPKLPPASALDREAADLEWEWPTFNRLAPIAASVVVGAALLAPASASGMTEAELEAIWPVRGVGDALRAQAQYDTDDPLAAVTGLDVSEVTVPSEANKAPTPRRRSRRSRQAQADEEAERAEAEKENRLRELARRTAWATKGDAALENYELATLDNYAKCSIRGYTCKCKSKNCKHKIRRRMRCGREACTGCMSRYHANHVGALREMLESLATAIRHRGGVPRTWMFEIATPDDLKGFVGKLASIRSRLSLRAASGIRTVRAPKISLIFTQDEGTLENITSTTGVQPVELALDAIPDHVSAALARRAKRIREVILDYANLVKSTGERLGPVDLSPVELDEALYAKMRDHEFRAWLMRSPMTTSGKRCEIPWPDSEMVREYARKQAQMRAEEKAGKTGIVLVHPDACPEHGTLDLEYMAEDYYRGETYAMTQPEIGRRPTRKAVKDAIKAKLRFAG